jgi:3-hydroxypropanoate dehydrogenase
MALDKSAFDLLFDEAHTHNKWQQRDVPDDLLRALVEHLKWAPTSFNSSPSRFVFVKSKEAKARLKPHLGKNNAEKTMSAPVTVIVGTDYQFYDHLPKLFPPANAKPWFLEDKEFADITAYRNGTLQGGYMIIAARALGLDCGPMSDFNNDGVDADFFAGTTVKSNFICNLGYGDPSGIRPRFPRFSFDEIAKIV